MNQGPDLLKAVRAEYSGDEGISCALPFGRADHPRPQGNSSKKQDELRQSIRELEDSIAYIDWKQNFYDEVLSGQRPYTSNLICTEQK